MLKLPIINKRYCYINKFILYEACLGNWKLWISSIGLWTALDVLPWIYWTEDPQNFTGHEMVEWWELDLQPLIAWWCFSKWVVPIWLGWTVSSHWLGLSKFIMWMGTILMDHTKFRGNKKDSVIMLPCMQIKVYVQWHCPVGIAAQNWVAWEQINKIPIQD